MEIAIPTLCEGLTPPCSEACVCTTIDWLEAEMAKRVGKCTCADGECRPSTLEEHEFCQYPEGLA